jgi:hypothetical protein
MEKELDAGVTKIVEVALNEIPDLEKYVDDKKHHDDDDDDHREKNVGLTTREVLDAIQNYIRLGRRVPNALILVLRGLCLIVRRWPRWLPKPWYYYIVRYLCDYLRL